MSKRKFTEEEITVLAANPYTFRVSPSQISFTKEFKQLFWSDYQKRVSPTEIFRKHGYDPAILGQGRVTGFQQSLKSEAECGLEFCDGKRDSGARKALTDADNPYSTTIRDMEYRLSCLEQGVDFLKEFICQDFQKVGGMHMNESSCVYEVIQSAISNHETKLSVSDMCELVGVSRSGYYAWLKAAPSQQSREEQDRRDFELILTACKKKGYSKGAKGISMCLLHMDPPVVMNLKKIRRLMGKYHLYCPIRKANPYRQLAKELRTGIVADNILQSEFESYGPRVVLLTDITFLPYNGTFAYLSTILDAFTKQILSYVVSDSLQVDFVLSTVEKLIRDQGISL